MKWNHLPVPGGIYDQHPRFVEEITYIFGERNAHQEREQKRKESESKRGGSGVAGGRGRR